jgi:hypothetical protein
VLPKVIHNLAAGEQIILSRLVSHSRLPVLTAPFLPSQMQASLALISDSIKVGDGSGVWTAEALEHALTPAPPHLLTNLLPSLVRGSGEGGMTLEQESAPLASGGGFATTATRDAQQGTDSTNIIFYNYINSNTHRLVGSGYGVSRTLQFPRVEIFCGSPPLTARQPRLLCGTAPSHEQMQGSPTSTKAPLRTTRLPRRCF